VNIRVALAIAAAFLSGCQNMPQPYAPPVQRQPIEDARPHRVSRMVNVTDPGAETHFVQDISGVREGSWRWTQQKPTVKIVQPTNENLIYTIDFTLPEVTFKTTGPVTLTFYVNDRALDHVRYEKPGQLHFEKPVPADWVTPGKETTLAAEIDKVWVSPQDGAKLGFILTRIGLTQ
jgi:hypothetical protein